MNIAALIKHPSAMAIYIHLGNKAAAGGQFIFTDRQKIANATGISHLDTVTDGMKKLQELRLIRYKVRTKNSNGNTQSRYYQISYGKKAPKPFYVSDSSQGKKAPGPVYEKVPSFGKTAPESGTLCRESADCSAKATQSRGTETETANIVPLEIVKASFKRALAQKGK